MFAIKRRNFLTCIEGDLKSAIIKKAAREGALGDIISTTSDLRTKLTVAEARAEQLRRSTAEFKVLQEYRELEQEASDLTRQINRLVDENTMDRQLIDDIEESLQEEAPPPDTKLEEVYQEAGVVLPALALKRFEDVRAFHQSVLANRHSYLRGEISASRRQIEHREETRSKNTKYGVRRLWVSSSRMGHLITSPGFSRNLLDSKPTWKTSDSAMQQPKSWKPAKQTLILSDNSCYAAYAKITMSKAIFCEWQFLLLRRSPTPSMKMPAAS